MVLKADVLKIIEITTFLYIKINKENEFFSLSNIQFIKKYCIYQKDIGQYLRLLIKNSLSGKVSISFWPDEQEDLLLNKLRELNIEDGISLLFRTGDSIDAFLLGPNIKKHDMKNFYLNHIELLKKFILYFRLKARSIISNIYCQRMIPLKIKIDFMSNYETKFLGRLISFRQQMFSERMMIASNIVLSRRETKCLLLILESKSMKSIANEMNISHRTVETLLQKIKCKTGWRTKVSLLNFMFQKNLFVGSFLCQI